MTTNFVLPLDTKRDAGLSITATVYDNQGTTQGSVSMEEISAGIYSASYDLSGVADGQYAVLFYTSTRRKGFGKLYVRSEQEVSRHEFEKKAEADARQVILVAEHDATQADLINVETNLTAEIDANEAKIDLLETKAQADARQVILVAEHDSTQADLAQLETDLDATPQEIYDLFTQNDNADRFKSSGNSKANELARIIQLLKKLNSKR